MSRHGRATSKARKRTVLVMILATATISLAGPPRKSASTWVFQDASHPVALKKIKLQSPSRANAPAEKAAHRSSIRIKITGKSLGLEDATKHTVVPSGRRVRINPIDDQLKDAHAAQEVAASPPLRGWILLHDAVFDPQTEAIYNALDVGRCYTIGQSYDPESFETGVIDIPRVITAVARNYPDGLRGYVQLDWEDPFFSILHAGPSHPRFEEVRDNYAEFMRSFKTAFPEALVTHYNIPFIPFWVENSNGSTVWWSKIDDKTLTRYEADLDELRPILDEMDWFCPRYFDFVPSAQLSEESRANRVQAEIDHRKAVVLWLKRYLASSDRPDRKIIPVARTRWSGGIASYAAFDNELIPRDEFIAEQLVPAMESGANGLLLFEVYETWMLDVAFTSPDQVSSELREKALAVLRQNGLLGENELPNWRSAAQKRAFLQALGSAQTPYLAAIASRMRAHPRVEDSGEEP